MGIHPKDPFVKMMKKSTTLVATLGGQPQIITFTLDLLLARGEQIDQVVIVYLASDLRCRGKTLPLSCKKN